MGIIEIMGIFGNFGYFWVILGVFIEFLENF